MFLIVHNQTKPTPLDEAICKIYTEPKEKRYKVIYCIML